MPGIHSWDRDTLRTIFLDTLSPEEREAIQAHEQEMKEPRDRLIASSQELARQVLLDTAPVCSCMDCGLPYEQFPLDIILPDEQWEQLTGRTDGGGLLCAACLVKRAARYLG